MLYNSQAQAGAPSLSGTAFVHAVKPLKYILLMLNGNPDPIILDDELTGYSDPDMPALFIVTNGIITEIVQKLLQQAAVRLNEKGRSLQRQGDPMAVRHRLHHIHAPGCQLIQVQSFESKLLFGRIVQLRQLQGIIDQGKEPLGIL